MRVLVTGRTGQLAEALRLASRESDIDLVLCGRPELDLTRPDSITAAIAAHKPSLIINTAAYTGVDAAESDRESAFRVNAEGAGHVAAAAEKVTIPVVHISTDYVFDGKASGPYDEGAMPNPQSVYGQSKLDGECAVMTATPHHLVLRTSWVYSPFGKNFVKTMLRLAAAQDEVSVVADQTGTPTYALDLAGALLRIAHRLDRKGADFSAWGVYHLAGAGEASWADLAEAVFEESRKLGGPVAKVNRVASSQFRVAAPRPANSRLSCDKFRSVFTEQLPVWRDRLSDCVFRIVAGQGSSV